MSTYPKHTAARRNLATRHAAPLSPRASAIVAAGRANAPQLTPTTPARTPLLCADLWAKLSVAIETDVPLAEALATVNAARTEATDEREG